MENTNFEEQLRQNRDENEIDLKQIVHVLCRKLVYIIIAGMVFGAISYMYFSFVAEKKYSSTAQIYVINNNSDTLSSSDITVSTSLSNDYVVLVTTRPVLEKVIADLDLDLSAKELEEMIEAKVVTGSRTISITVTDTSPVRAKKIVDSVTSVSIERISEVMKTDMGQPLEEGEIAKTPSSPNVTRNVIIAFIIGAIIASGIVILMYILNDKIVTTEDVEKYLGVGVIGLIPVFTDERVTKKTRR